MSRISRYFTGIDWILLGATVPILCAGLVTMSSFTGSNYFFTRQIVWILVAVILFFFSANIDWRFLRRTGIVVYLYLGSLLIPITLFFFRFVFFLCSRSVFFLLSLSSFA